MSKEPFPNYFNFKINGYLIEEICDILKENEYIPKSDDKLSYHQNFYNEKVIEILQERVLKVLENILNQGKGRYYITINPKSLTYIKYANNGYFTDLDKSFKLNKERYTLLIGLTNCNYYTGGKIILWFPVDQDTKDDYYILKYSDDYNLLYQIFKKRNISHYNKENLFEKLKDIRDSIKDTNFIPKYFDLLSKGKSLIFKGDIPHSGEKFLSFEKIKELLSVDIDIHYFENEDDTLNDITLYPRFERWMVPFSNNVDVIPFQIILTKGTYNDQIFTYIFPRYYNFNNQFIIKNNISLKENLENTIDDISMTIKKKLNKRYREYHCSCEVLKQSELNIDIPDKLSFNCYKGEMKHLQIIDTYIQNVEEIILKKIKYEKEYISYHEKVENVWDEVEGKVNEYSDITYLDCDIYIFYAFLKIKGI